MQSTNQQKHLSKNPIQRYLIKQYYKNLQGVLATSDVESVLDVGCGEGYTLQRLASPRKYGLDRSEAAVQQASLEAEAMVASIYHLPYQDDSFDCVLCLEVLEHLLHSPQAVDELIRVAKRYVVISVPHEPWFSIANAARGRHWPAGGNHPEHVHWYTRSQINQLFAKHRNLFYGYSFPWQIAIYEKV